MFSAAKKICSYLLKVLAGVLSAGMLFYGSVYAQTVATLSPTEPQLKIDEGLANDALVAGFSDIAEDFAKKVLARQKIDAKTEESALMTLASAQIEQGKFSEATGTLSKIKTDSDAKKLRLALTEIGKGKFDSAASILSSISAEKLSSSDKGWFALSRGIVDMSRKEIVLAKTAFAEADSMSISAGQKMHFEFVRFWAELILSVPKDEDLKTLRERAIEKLGTADGARYAKLLVAAYLAKGEISDPDGNAALAREVLREFKVVPKKQQAEFDILDALSQNNPASTAARQAYMRAIRLRPERRLQEVALEGLYRGVALLSREENKENAILAANEIKRFFDGSDLPAGTPPLPPDSSILDFELFTRLRIARLSGDESLAIKLATELTEKCPTSPAAASAYNLRLNLIINEKEYRRAVTLLERQRDLMPESAQRERQNCYIADCYFLNGDYNFAASAYAKIKTNLLTTEEQGLIFFQLVLSKIRGAHLSDVASLIDDQLSEMSIPAPWIQRSECALISALRDAGELEVAAQRCANSLRERDMLWQFRIYILELQASLALELGNPELAVKNAELMSNIVGALPEIEWPKDFFSRTMLLKARGLLRGNDDKAANEQLSILRERFSGTSAAVVSYLEEGRALANKKQPAGALSCYEKMIERYGNMSEFEEYVSIAYFEAAQQAATLGRQRDAIQFLDTLVAKSPNSQLRFYARLRQADLFRVLNDFDSALAVYDNLIVTFPGHPDIYRVGISRADCLLALALAVGDEKELTSHATKVANLEKAISAYERLYSLPGASYELKAEAGFKWGYATSQAIKLTENPTKTALEDSRKNSIKIYFVVYNTIFNKATAGGVDPTTVWGISSGYWISRSLFAMAELYEEDSDYENARKTYTQIINWSGRNWIPGGKYAQTRLDAIAGK